MPKSVPEDRKEVDAVYEVVPIAHFSPKKEQLDMEVASCDAYGALKKD